MSAQGKNYTRLTQIPLHRSIPAGSRRIRFRVLSIRVGLSVSNLCGQVRNAV